MKALLFSLALVVSLSAAQSTQTFTGIISDEMCGNSHASMRMGPTDAECATTCVMVHDTFYILWDGKEAWILSDQTTPEAFAGKKVTVIGRQDVKTKTIQVEKITAAK